MTKRAPLVWLQAFEAAGRTGSFKAAAQELNVSPSNVSHQVRDLEAYLGCLLFSRNGRHLQLTTEGQQLLPALSDGFQLIRNAQLDQDNQLTRLHIGAFPYLANEILTPNLSELKNSLQGLDVRLFTHTDVASLQHPDPQQRLDVVVRYGAKPARFVGLAASHLTDVALVPIAGGDLASDLVTTPEELLSQPLIRVIGPFQGWERWCEHYCPGLLPQHYVLETDSFHAAMLAVARGEGICLGISPYIAPWSEQGRIMTYAAYTLPITDAAAYVVYGQHRQNDPAIGRFVHWLQRTLQVNDVQPD